MTLYEKSMNTLELPAVLEQLALRASSEGGKELCLQLRPSGDKFTVQHRLEETSAAKQMSGVKGSPSFFGLKDCRNALQRADMSGVLNTRELLDIAALLSCTRAAKAYADSGRDEEWKSTSLYGRFAALTANKFLEEKITLSIVGEDEISDGASKELLEIRRKIKAASARVRESLQKIISSPTYAKALQEPIITTRSDRFVVPVKAEHKNAIQGLVHDISSSGATVFIEPMSCVKANNEIRELRIEEKREIERILAELSADCAAYREPISTDYVILTELDFIFAKAKLSYELDCGEAKLSDKELLLKRARHPLLPKEKAVPIDISLGEEFDTLVITGPNTGGKTVSIKTMGLLSLMTLCGLHIPAADGSTVPVFSEILADIGDEQSIEQSLSTFSAHMTNIVGILAEAKENTLVLFDELGAGTDPVEGAALAIAIIERVRQYGACVAATTHYSELKVYALTSKGVQNASCEFNVNTLRPTYRLLIGIPGKSNAFAISERLGLASDVIEDAKGRVGVASARMEDVIEKLESRRQELEARQGEAERKLREAEAKLKDASRIRAELSVRLEMAEEKARREAADILADARRNAEAVFEELDRIRKMESGDADHRRVNEARAALRRSLNEQEEKLDALSDAGEEVSSEDAGKPVKPGDSVKLKTMGGVKADVISVNADGSLVLQAGILKVTALREDVIPIDAPKTEIKPPKGAGQKLQVSAVPREIDLRGMMSDEAVLYAERYLDQAVMGRLETCTIIHGKGTGALRAAIHNMLKKNKHVKTYRLGNFGEGEMGVTVVTLR
ncbi:MAG: endonuclease MutS2 [Oscillospiraceae bacterium]|nr:endonuclease MutS2 [Oscillospiraceae bacterium]